MIAQLGMYDWPELREATDDFWRAWRDAIRTLGGKAPEALTRDRAPPDVWPDPDLIVAQTCGLPYVSGRCGAAQLLATPCYAVPGCSGPTYRSAIIARADDRAETMAAFKGVRAAINDPGSQSGFAALLHHVGTYQAQGGFFGEVIETGAHRASAQAIANGGADIAAIDAVCWAVIAKHLPDLARSLKVVEWTDPVPALPYITANPPRAEMTILRTALQTVFEDDRLKATRHALFLDGFQILDDTAYDPIRHMRESNAHRRLA